MRFKKKNYKKTSNLRHHTVLSNDESTNEHFDITINKYPTPNLTLIKESNDAEFGRDQINSLIIYCNLT